MSEACTPKEIKAMRKRGFWWRLWHAPLYVALNTRRSSWNSGTALIGCWLLFDSWAHFFGAILVLESLHVTLEGCWRDDADEM